MPFLKTEVQHFDLLTQVKIAFRGQMVWRGCLRPWSKRLLKALEKADRAILTTVPHLEKLLDDTCKFCKVYDRYGMNQNMQVNCVCISGSSYCE